MGSSDDIHVFFCFYPVSIVAVSEPLVVGSSDGNLALRLHFEAEHTNVLIIQIEVLQGCLMETEIDRMNVELVLQEKPISLVILTK